MFSYPYFGFPYYHRPSRYGYYYSPSKQPPAKNYVTNVGATSSHPQNSAIPDKKEETSSNNEDSPLFQIFGLNLYFDDILLVCLIFFLYQEGVKDEGLFLALILLLLS